MKDHPEEKRGRRWLAALLLLNLLLTALERTLPVWPYRSGPVLLLTAAGLLPTAVVLWGTAPGQLARPGGVLYRRGPGRGRSGGAAPIRRRFRPRPGDRFDAGRPALPQHGSAGPFPAGRRQPLLGAAPPAPPPRGPGPGGRSVFVGPCPAPPAGGAAARRVFLRKPLTLREKGLVKGQKR